MFRCIPLVPVRTTTKLWKMPVPWEKKKKWIFTQSIHSLILLTREMYHPLLWSIPLRQHQVSQVFLIKKEICEKEMVCYFLAESTLDDLGADTFIL